MPGFRFVEVPADTDGPALGGAMWYPCAEPPGEIDLGKIAAMFGITIAGAKDCPVDGFKLPLVVVSHGRGGHFFSHHDTIEMLAEAGFVLAAINHPGDTYFDMTRSGDLSAYVDRPTDIKRLIDYMLFTSPAAPNIDRQRIGFYGFSRGGYTGLVLIGGNPDWAGATVFCQRHPLPRGARRSAERSFRPRHSHTTHGSKPPSLPTRSRFSLLATALRRLRYQCSSGPPNWAATA
jgi:predicted dienelactone hydrolase